MYTVLRRIEERSVRNPKTEWKNLMIHFSRENLLKCYHELDGKKAVGSDKITKEKYGENLMENLENLVGRLKTMSYRPEPVKEVLIPKENGKTRPLGISNFEDKIIQAMVAKMLTAIYDPLMNDCSFGFRPGRSCHDAIKTLAERLDRRHTSCVIDVDLKNFFGEINHFKLVAILRMKIKDEKFIRYIVRMLKAGILREGMVLVSESGSPQGSVCSPILANIFAHYCIDNWIETVPQYTNGNVDFVRYADDFVIRCENKEDAPRIIEGLKNRLQRFSLILNEDKTKIVTFNSSEAQRGNKQDTFDFLGFTFYLGKTRRGRYVRKLKTSSKKFRNKIKLMNEWCKKGRYQKGILKRWKIFQAKIRGHIQYYSVSFNTAEVLTFIAKSTRIFFKWLNRRSQKKSKNWEEFNRFIKEYPLPRVRIIHKLF